VVDRYKPDLDGFEGVFVIDPLGEDGIRVYVFGEQTGAGFFSSLPHVDLFPNGNPPAAAH
jgi:hypothetical protein